MQGYYYDPLHGGCLRLVTQTSSSSYLIRGVYGSDETHTHEPWTAVAREHGTHGEHGRRFLVDFAGKPCKRPRYLTCVYVDRTLRWEEDGNVWVQLYVHRPSQVWAGGGSSSVGSSGRRGRDAV